MSQVTSQRHPLPRTLVWGLAVMAAGLIACGPRPLPPRAPAPPPPAAEKPAPATEASASSAQRVPQTSLLEHVPVTASLVAVFRRNSLAWLERAYASDPVMAEAMRAHFTTQLGVDFTGLKGVVLIGFGEGEQLGLAMFLHVPSISTIKGSVRGLHRDLPLVAPNPTGSWVAASLREGVWIGDEGAVKRALDHELDHGTSLFIDVDGPDVDVLGFLRLDDGGSGTTAALSSAFGIEHALLKLDATRKVTLILKGRDQRIEKARAAFDAALGVVLSELSSLAQTQGTDPWVGALGLFAYHQVRSFVDAVKPRMVNLSLVSEYQLGTWLDSAPLGAAAAALTVPAVLAQVTRGKTGQARTELLRVASALSAYHDATRPATPRKNAPPPVAQLRIGKTPRVVPCGTDVRWDEAEMAAWQELGYAPASSMRYSLEVGHPKSFGRREPPEVVLMVRAEGDLDCDGTLSRYELVMQLDEDGKLVRLGDIEVTNDGE
jgi:hypothetical protein